jgi:hypothetical protein
MLKYKLSVCTVIKNEVEYMNDFLTHYINQDVEHFFIINNNSTDGIEEWIENHPLNKIITLINDNTEMKYNIDGSETHKQILNNNLYPILKEKTEWAIIVDIDEFMFGKNNHTISSFIDTLEENVNGVYVYWNIMKPAIDENSGEITECFSIEKSLKRLNLDLLDKLPWNIQWASKFGKSLFKTSSLNDSFKLIEDLLSSEFDEDLMVLIIFCSRASDSSFPKLKRRSRKLSIMLPFYQL